MYWFWEWAAATSYFLFGEASRVTKWLDEKSEEDPFGEAWQQERDAKEGEDA